MGPVAVGARGQELAVGAHGYAAQLLALPAEALGRRTVRKVPDRQCRRIPGGGDQLPSVWDNGERVNSLIHRQRPRTDPCAGRVPLADLDRPLVVCGDEGFAAGGESQSRDHSRVQARTQDFRAGDEVA